MYSTVDVTFMTHRGWCGTQFQLENFDPPEQPTPENKVKYFVYQLEECPDTGALHLQFYVEFTSPQRYTAVRRLVGVGAHWEPRQGTPAQADAYCRKRETQVVGPSWIGERPSGQGSRTDLAAVQAALDSGETPQAVAREHFATWARYYRAIDRYYLEHQPPRTWEMDVRVYFGQPGSGKSRRAFDEAGADCYALGHSNGAAWFDGYAGQHTVVIDDFYGWLSWSFLLQLLDRYPFRVPTKGSHLPFVSRRIIFTSNSHPSEWYDYIGKPHMKYDALARRITTLEEMTLEH